MADDDPPMIQVRRSTAIRVSIAVAVLVALGVGFGIGYAVHSPTTKPSKGAVVGNTGAWQHFFESSTTTTRALSATTTTAPTTTTNPARQILSPATTPPVVDECSVPITSTADGNPDPTTCPAGGGVNVVAWRYIANTYSNILGLGANTSEQQVFQAMCNSPTPGGEISLAAIVAATYYGWTFASALTGFPVSCSAYNVPTAP